MLVNCPKCGFSQPNDRYCASCGIDMELFRPAKVSLWKRILSSPLLHVGFVFVLVFASIFYIRQKQREELQARVEYLKGGPLLVERSQPTQVQLDASSEAQAQIAQQAPPPAPAAAPSASNASTEGSEHLGGDPAVGVSADKTQSQAPAILANQRTASAGPTRVRIIYAEVELPLLNAWTEEMRQNNYLRIFDDVAMGALPNVSQKLKSERGIKILQRIEQPLSHPSPPLDWFVGTHRGLDPESEMGFYSSLVVGDFKEGLLRGEIEIQRAFRDPKDPTKTMERISHGGPFELPSGHGFMIRGLLPRKFITDLEEAAQPDPVLSIFKSPAFREGLTEFTMILEFDNTSP